MSTARKPRILVVDDEENISFLLCTAWNKPDRDVKSASNGHQALTVMDSWQPDVVVIDIGLPDIDGFEVLRRTRNNHPHTSVIMLTARGDTIDRVRGLSMGADDYVAKPFSLEELSARIDVCLRRIGSLGGTMNHVVSDLVLDDDAHRLWRGEVEIFLTPTEYKLLLCLMTNVGRVVTRNQILEYVWEWTFDGDSSIIESFISNIRKKVDFKEPKLIHTMRGLGYTMREL